MKCPECESEVADGATTCPECGADLVEHPQGPLVEVFRTADASLLPVIESVLLGEGIEFLVAGEEGQALFPLGSIGGGPDKRFLGAVVRVREADAEGARAALATVSGSDEEE